MDQEFVIKENGFEEIKKGLVLKTLPIMIVAVGVGLLIFHFNNDGKTSEMFAYLTIIPMITIVLSFSLRKSIKMQRELFNSYRLLIDDNQIIRELNNTPTITIPFTDIRLIEKKTNGILVIMGSNVAHVISVPAQIEDIEQLEELLSEIHPITTSDKKTLVEKYLWFFVALMLGAMATVYLSRDIYYVGISGAFIILFLGYSIYQIQQNKNIDQKTKNRSWISILVILSVIGTMYYKMKS